MRPSAGIAVAAVGLAVCWAGCVHSEATARSSGVRTKGSAAPDAPEAFAELDRLLEERIRALEQAGQGLHRSLTVEYRKALLGVLVPELRRRVGEARARGREALADRSGRRQTLMASAGTHYECAMVASTVLAFEVELVRFAEAADEKGQSSWQLAGTLRRFDADMTPLMMAAASLDRARVRSELEKAAPAYQRWLKFLDGWARALGKGETWSRWGYLVADALMLGISAHELAVAAAEGMNLGPPPLGGVSLGGAAVMARVDPAALEHAAEAIRRLIQVGALDGGVVFGIDALVRPMAANGPPGPKQLELPLKLPERGPRDPKAPIPPEVKKINGRLPINHVYAGRLYGPEDLPPKLRDKYPGGVLFSPEGFPKFGRYSRATVALDGLTGISDIDAPRANRAVGLGETPEGWTWHHVEDGRTMQLIPRDLHEAVDHTGGRAILRHLRNAK